MRTGSFLHRIRELSSPESIQMKKHRDGMRCKQRCRASRVFTSAGETRCRRPLMGKHRSVLEP
jgi:hypothetical protein